MSRQNNRFLTLCAAATAGLVLAGTAQAVDLRSWDQKINDVTKRFIVLASFNNEAVLDKETQLVWERTPSPLLWTYGLAIDHCLINSLGDRSGWRLPTAHELRSLLTNSAGMPAGHPFDLTFPSATPRIWSSTKNTVYNGTTRFYAVELGDYHPGTHYAPTVSLPVWCVRGPAADAASY